MSTPTPFTRQSFTRLTLPLSQASLILALGIGLAACKDTPSQTHATATDNSLATPTTSSATGAPVVDAGGRQIADTAVTVVLTGSASFGDGAHLQQAEWTQIAGPAVTLMNPAALTTQFVSPSVDTTTPLTFRLTVMDDQGRSSADTVRITVSPLAGALRVTGGSATEGNSFNFTVSISKTLAAPLVVHYNTVDGTALMSTDYNANTGSVTLEPGASSATIAVETRDDTEVETPETLTLSVSTELNGDTVNSNATLTITDNDAVVLPPLAMAVDYLLAVLNRQSVISNFSDSRGTLGNESLLQNPIVERYNRIACESGSYQLSLDEQTPPRLDQPITETAVNCLFQGVQRSGSAEYSLTNTGGDFYDGGSQASFTYDYNVDQHYTHVEQGTAYANQVSGTASFTGYNFEGETGLKQLVINKYAMVINDVETSVIDHADVTLFLEEYGAPAVQWPKSNFTTRIADGLLQGQSMTIQLLESAYYNNYGEGGISDGKQIFWNEEYLLPSQGRTLYRVGNIEIVARYTKEGFYLQMDLDENGCVDTTAELHYFETLPASPLDILDTVPDGQCMPLDTSETTLQTQQPTDNTQLINGDVKLDGNTQLDSNTQLESNTQLDDKVLSDILVQVST